MLVMRSFVAVAVSLLALESLSSAEMTGMSLQERMRLADLVVVGTILETHKISVDMKTATEYWRASFQVELTIKEEKKAGEEEKRGRRISVAFIRMPLAKSANVNLWEGKRYLLFLRGTESQQASERLYEMITPYHGAFEAGQDHFVHDEQSPEYPQAVKMSFKEIVRRITPQGPASSSAAEQVKVAQPLTLTIQTAKEVYEQGEPINIEVSIRNSGNDTAKIYSPAHWGVSEITVTNSKGVAMKPRGVKVKRAFFEPFLTIPPQSSAAYTFDNLAWFDCGGVWQFAFADDAQLLSDTYQM